MLKRLVLIRLKSMFAASTARGKKGNSTGKIILFTLLMIYCLGAFGFLFINMFSSFYDGFAPLGMEWLYFGFMGLMIFALCFIGSVFVTQQQLFEAKDNDLLLSMPVPVRYILISRLLSILALNYIFELLVALPGAGVYLYKGEVDPLGFFYFVIMLLILPLIVMTISVLFGWLIALADAKIGKKNVVMTILAMGLLLVYLYVCFRLQSYVTLLIENGQAIGQAIRKALPPFYYMGNAAADGDTVAFLIFLLCCIIPFVLVYGILSKSFINIATANKGSKKIVYKEKSVKAIGVKAALRRKEMRHFLSSPMYMFNAALGLVFLIIGAGYLFIKRDQIAMIGQLLSMLAGDEGIFTALLCAIIGLILSMNIISAPMISIEAKTLWISQSLPVQTKDVLNAKAGVHIFASLPFILVSVILVEIALDMSLTGRVLIALCPVLITVFDAYLGLTMNLIYPKLDWINEIDAVKQGAAPILSMFIAMATIAVPVLLYIFVFMDMISTEAYTAIILGFFAVGTAGLYRFVVKNGVRRFTEL